MSVWARPMLAANTAVIVPIQATTSSDSGAISKSLWQRATMYTPAVTMVAAWMRADTGVGPSMASGSHVYSGICADLPVAPMKRRSAMARYVPTPTLASAAAKTSL